MPHVIQPAATARSKCRGCGERIAAGALRFGESLPNPFAEGETTHWFHLDCAAYKRPEPILETLASRNEPLDGADALVAAAKFGIDHRRVPRINGAEHDTSGRAKCRSCRNAIAKGLWRIPLVFYEEGRFSPGGFIHASCARAYFETIDILPRLKRFAPALTDADLAEVSAELARPAEG